ncbi:MAG: hypothetical protein CBC49_010915 [Alphaproteobacteria bacterium TMED89]|nr:hypothetical protein [Rhodospirillaceae bacterium]RPH10170.1 MAG: hypothetical protein CBC49_010915 [Alphaproteobacteria bacterium TMED89]
MHFKPEMDNQNFLLQDLRRNYVRAAANQGWFEQEWMGVPVWQLGEDLVRLQRAVTDVRPKWIIETGTKFGGSAIFFGSVLHGLGLTDSRVITLDIQAQDVARQTFANHTLKDYVADYIVDDAVSPQTIARVTEHVIADPGPTLVFLDDNHNRDHVLAELRAYSPLVTENSLIIVADTVFGELVGTPVGKPTDKYWDVAASNPRGAVEIFLDEVNGAFTTDDSFIGSGGPGMFPDGFLRRVR